MRLEMRRPPWRYSQPKLVQTGAQVCQQRHEVVYEKSDGACTSSGKKIILSHRNTPAEPPDIKFRKPFADHATYGWTGQETGSGLSDRPRAILGQIHF